MNNTSHPPSDRSFGLLFALVFAGLGGYGLYRGWPGIAVGTVFGAGLLFLLAALIAARILAPLNRAWLLLGDLLHRLVSPLVLGILFFGLLTPLALIGKALGRDELRLKRRAKASHWIQREPPGPGADSFRQQF